MPCNLHVELPEGAQALADRLSIKPYAVQEKGQSIRQRPGHTYDRAYLSFDVSDADFDQLPRQFDDAVVFLQTHAVDVRFLTEVGEAYLDFGYSPRRGEPGFTPIVQVDRLPQELVRLAASLDVEIELSLYVGWGEEDVGG